MIDLDTVTLEEKQSLNLMRKKRFILFIAFLLYLPLTVALHTVTHSDKLVGFLAVSYLLSWAFLGLSLSFSRCPRCHEYFFTTCYLANPLTNKCMHCGLKIKAENIKEDWNDMRSKWEGEETTKENK
jgi:hypothetical protein